MSIVTRFAPSPTGLFHAGSYRTALFAYIFAKQNKGKFILRIEDTDKERSKKEYEDNILDSLAWLGLGYDELFCQSDRTVIYEKYLQKLIDTGHAYVSDLEAEIARAKERGQDAPTSSVIRFKNPNKKVTFDDLIRGKVSFDTTELGDFVIAKSMTEPIFHLVNVIDDFEMGVTHIIRGEDHISNTPRQMLIFEAIGAKPPIYAHIPLLLSKDRSKLSKRHGALSMTEYRNGGYLPDALVNYMSLLGWHPADDVELMTLSEIISKFSLDRVQKGGAIFDEDKLKWFNRQYLIKMSEAEFLEKSRSFWPEWLAAKADTVSKILPIIREKIAAFGEITDLFKPRGELAFVEQTQPYEVNSLLWKKNPDKAKAREHLSVVREKLQPLVSSAAAGLATDTIKATIWPYVEATGKGDVLWPLRMSLTGQERSPDPIVCLSILGLEEGLMRITKAIDLLSK